MVDILIEVPGNQYRTGTSGSQVIKVTTMMEKGKVLRSGIAQRGKRIDNPINRQGIDGFCSKPLGQFTDFDLHRTGESPGEG